MTVKRELIGQLIFLKLNELLHSFVQVYKIVIQSILELPALFAVFPRSVIRLFGVLKLLGSESFLSVQHA